MYRISKKNHPQLAITKQHYRHQAYTIPIQHTYNVMDIVVGIVRVASWRIKRVRRACLTSRFYWCVRSVVEVVKGWRFACNVYRHSVVSQRAPTYYISDHYCTRKQLLCLCYKCGPLMRFRHGQPTAVLPTRSQKKTQFYYVFN